jgi:Zn-dependent metalloprotease
MTDSNYPHVAHGIIPPHVLQNIARNGSPAQRERAISALSLDASLRQLRVSQRESTRRSTRGPAAVADAAKSRNIYDAHQLTELPGSLVRSEGEAATDDVAVNEAYDYMGGTWDFYSAIFGRNSWDDAGGELVGTVHYDQDYDNAFWNGEQMVYGDGDGEIFNRFTISVDVIGHELTHGVTQAESQLEYQGQSGALNESVSDVFGSLVKQFLASETADLADWLIGEGLFTSAVNGVALRSMAAPGTAYDDPVIGKDPQPAHMDGYVETTDDNGGVHINSGIPNHAFYLFALALGGYAWETAGRVWYATCTDDSLAADVTFSAFAELTVSHAQSLLGDAGRAALVEAWNQVGIPVGAQGGGGGGQEPWIAVLNTNHELLVQRGPSDAPWTTVASDVQAFAVSGQRIGVLDSSGQLLLQEGGSTGAWTVVARDVGAFALDGISSTAPVQLQSGS